MSGNVFAAAASALGYLYQLRYGLLTALRKQTLGLNWSIVIEGADDVEVYGSHDHEVHQTKHRAPGSVLGDADSDLWKTIRVWSEGIVAGKLDSETTTFLLVTTAAVTPGSIAACLADEEHRDVDDLVHRLLEVSSKSTSERNASAYKAFKSLDGTARRALVRNTICVPTSPNIEQVQERVKAMLRISVRPEHLDAFVERAEGWWFERAIRCLVGDAAIEGPELESYLYNLRDQFQPTNLPIDDDVLDMDRPDIEPHSQRIYVRQVLLAQIGSYRLQQAIHDYLRAYTQRSRWLRENFIVAGELARYESRLKEEWSILFHRWSDEMSPEAAEVEKITMAQKIYAWAEDASLDPIRRDCTQQFVTRGSLHMLADQEEIGWHPNFARLLRGVLEPEAATGG